jgi:hypothetical protein
MYRAVPVKGFAFPSNKLSASSMSLVRAPRGRLRGLPL